MWTFPVIKIPFSTTEHTLIDICGLHTLNRDMAASSSSNANPEVVKYHPSPSGQEQSNVEPTIQRTEFLQFAC